MLFQERDGQILETIHKLDGVAARRHLKRLFWKETTWRAMEVRLQKLHEAGYLEWPTIEQRRLNAIPEPIVWLDWRGAHHLAGVAGLSVRPPTQPNESQLRRLERDLRKKGFRWLREPRWNQLAHDMALIDFRLAVEGAIRGKSSLTLETWINEGEFLSRSDLVEFTLKKRNGGIKRTKKGVRPDGYFVVVDEQRKSSGLAARARFLVELDNATHPNPRFGREKALPGAAYIKSPAYRDRFGDNSGRWLIVTNSGKRRLKNLLDQTLKSADADAGLFWFTTLCKALNGDPLTSPIWFVPGTEGLRPLFKIS